MSSPSSAPSGQLLQHYLRMADAALRGGNTQDALRIGEEAAARGLEHPNLLTLAAHYRTQAGNDGGAIAALRRARELSPHSVDVLNALGVCLVRTDNAREALAVFDAALRQAPANAMLRFNKALAFEKLGEPGRVRGELERVIALEPRQAESLGWLASLAAQRNDAAAVRDYAARALALDPKLTIAVLALATIGVAEGDFAAARARLEPLLRDAGVSPLNRSFAQSLVGDALDGESRPAEAFAAYAAAKAALRALYAPSFAAAKAEPALARVQRLTEYFRSADARAWRAPEAMPAGAGTHVFLVGFPRSGTTLLEQVLASHPDVESMEERDCLLDGIDDFIAPDGGLERLAALPRDECERYRKAYWKRAGEFGHSETGAVFVDKMPLNTILLPLVAKLFPAAKILFALRDPRDVVLSCFRRRFAMTGQMYELTTLGGAAAYYAAVMELGDIYREKFALDICEARHEALISDFDGETRRLCGFLGLEWHEAMRDFASRAQAGNIDTPSAAQVARGLSRDNTSQWRRYARELASVLPMLEPFVARYGYPEA